MNHSPDHDSALWGVLPTPQPKAPQTFACGCAGVSRVRVSVRVEGGNSGYLRKVCDYVHLNPVRARLLAPAEPLENFGWSSYGAYLKAPKERPSWLRENDTGSHLNGG